MGELTGPLPGIGRGVGGGIVLDYGPGGHPFERRERERERERGMRRREEEREGLLFDPPTDFGGSVAGDDVYVEGKDGDGVMANVDVAFEQQGAPYSSSEKSRYQPVRIHFEMGDLNSSRGKSREMDRRIDLVVDTVLPAIAELWSRSLGVIPVSGPIAVSQDACWGYQRGSGLVEGADLMIFVGARYDEMLGCEEGGDNNALAVAAPCESDQYDRPVLGIINFCLEEYGGDQDDNEQGDGPAGRAEDLISIGAHEVGHVLGFASELFKYFRDGETGEPLTERPFRLSDVTCSDGSAWRTYRASPSTTLEESFADNGVRHFELITPRVSRIVRSMFDCPSLRGARLENQPTGGSCFGSHWDERLFFTDLMGGVHGRFVNALSPLTLAFFEDTGWYRANYTNSNPSVFGRGAGCDFVNGDCIVDGRVPDYSEGFFCNDPLEVTLYSGGGGDIAPSAITCDPSRTHQTVCDLFDYGDLGDITGRPVGTIPAPFRYFASNPNLGAVVMPLADYCPIPNIHYADCQDPYSQETAKNVVVKQHFGEDSRCYDATWETKTTSFREAGSIRQSLCLRTLCDATTRSVMVEVHGALLKCEHDGQVHPFPSLHFSLTCPRFAVVCPHLSCPFECSGRGECDWSSPGGHPECVCDDPDDLSPGCNGVIEKEGPAAAVTVQPSTAQPSTAQPSTAQPSTAQPSTAQPSTAEPSTSQPSTAQPLSAQPSTGRPTLSPTELVLRVVNVSVRPVGGIFGEGDRGEGGGVNVDGDGSGGIFIPPDFSPEDGGAATQRPVQGKEGVDYDSPRSKLPPRLFDPSSSSAAAGFSVPRSPIGMPSASSASAAAAFFLLLFTAWG